MIVKEPVDHILRPRLPWRSESDPSITECGYDSSSVKSITREEFFQRLKDMGQQRASLFTCMTCSDTARRWRTWDDDPRQALEREINWEGVRAWGRVQDRGRRLWDELLAIAALIQAHPDEFKALVTDVEQRRSWLEKKSKLGHQEGGTRPRSRL